jgi:D-glycero-D-manno-heptose 1,7-bisphosphate phosphatase
MKNKAIFLDRDGVINELVYHEEHGLLDSPCTVEQFRMFTWVGESISNFRKMGFKVVVVSNQPGIAKGHFSIHVFKKIKEKMRSDLFSQGVEIDGEYYCLHHPEAKVEHLKTNCSCRKPQPGLLLQAAEEMNIDLGQSWMIGDGLTDIQAGKRAGCKTILICKMKCELCQMMNELNARPDINSSNLLEACLSLSRT